MAYMNRGKSFGGRGGGKKFGGGGSGAPWKKRDSRDGGSSRSQMYDAVCSQCGNGCQVPFRPNGKKPVLCSMCFGQSGGGEGKKFSAPRRESSSFRSAPSGDASVMKQLQMMNEKLDSIIEALEL